MLSRLGRVESARHAALECVSLAETGCPEALAVALCAQATVQINAGETEKALAVSERTLANGIRDAQLRPKALYVRGVALHNTGRYDEARADFLQALALAEALGTVREEVWLVWSLGCVARQQQDYDDAERWWRRTLDRARAIGMSEHVALALTGLGIIAKECAQYRVLRANWPCPCRCSNCAMPKARYICRSDGWPRPSGLCARPCASQRQMPGRSGWSMFPSN